MTYEEAYSILECLAIDMTGAIASKPNEKISKDIEAINIAQALLKDAMVDSCEEYMEFTDADWCYECGGYGDDYSVDDDGNLVSNCDNCIYNERSRE